jgi:DNA polymerase-3 subunit delta'
VKWIEDISKWAGKSKSSFVRYFNHSLEQSIRLRAMGDLSMPGIGANQAIMPEKGGFCPRLNKWPI